MTLIGHRNLADAITREKGCGGDHSARPSLRSGHMAEWLFDADERDRLCLLLDELGPQAPTLLEPWTTHDLAAHLFLREHDFVAAPGLVVPGAWGRFAERRRVALKEKAFTELVAAIRAGPPRGFFRIGWVRRLPNLNEFFVHNEDVRRANGFGPRTNAPEEDAALFRNVARTCWFLRAGFAARGSTLRGKEQTRSSARGEANRPLDSAGFPESCSCSSSDGGTPLTSRSLVRPRPSQPFSGLHSGCDPTIHQSSLMEYRAAG